MERDDLVDAIWKLLAFVPENMPTALQLRVRKELSSCHARESPKLSFSFIGEPGKPRFPQQDVRSFIWFDIRARSINALNEQAVCIVHTVHHVRISGEIHRWSSDRRRRPLSPFGGWLAYAQLIHHKSFTLSCSHSAMVVRAYDIAQSCCWS